MTSIAAWKAAGSYFDFKGRQIFFREDGSKDAPALLLIHGLPSASWDYDLIWPELIKEYRVLTLDMLGFGFSDKPYRHDYSVVEQADIYDELLRQCGVTSYHLFAHDYGVSVGQELMARDMEGTRTTKILSVALLNGGLFPELAMTLDDLDWERGEILVRGKGQRLERLPLPKDVGTALVRYLLRRVRPACSTRNVFIRLKAPIAAFVRPPFVVWFVALSRAPD
jgi:pimeloyl-ACP methyl ester carboxylesterase